MAKDYGSDTLTRGIRVRVAPFYLPHESSETEGRFVFGYRVTIRNEGSTTVQLMRRHWIIIDGDGQRQDVRGPGVVGRAPILEPGDEFEYSSFCPLTTTWGSMEGSFQMRAENGEEFDAQIGRFLLTMESKSLVSQMS